MPDVKTVFIGDTYVQRPDPDSAFTPNLPYFKDADIVFCNLETVIADAKYLAPWDTTRRPRTDEAILASYLKAGINVMNLANNPSMYHGVDAFVRSLDVLDAAGVVHGGGGRNITEARKPAIIERNGTKVAFVCRTSVGLVDAGATDVKAGVARFRVATTYEAVARIHEVPGSPPIIHTIPDPEDKAALEEDIRTARSQADVVIVSWHWGVSPATGGAGALVGYQIEMGHFAIDAGADMVVGHHAHMVQPIEVYKGRPIVYGLSNYIHDMGTEPHRENSSMLVKCLVRDGKVARLSFVPGRLVGNGPPSYHRPAEAPEVVAHMEQVSREFGTQFRAGADDVEVILAAQ